MTEHAFPRADGEYSDATTSAVNVGSRRTRERALGMCMSDGGILTGAYCDLVRPEYGIKPGGSVIVPEINGLDGCSPALQTRPKIFLPATSRLFW